MRGVMIDESQLRGWVARAQGGDREAFDRLVGAVRPDLEAALGPDLERLRQRGIDRDDVLQETLVKAFGALERFEWREEGSLLRWLCGIARHVMLKAVRQAKRRPGSELRVDVPAPGPTASRAARREERLERLEASLASLSPDHRRVIRLARIEGLKTEEIARRMGRSPEAVRQLLVRALRALRASFGETDSLSLPPRGLERGGSRDT
jgi:RNA polymerase sigma-70 factor (ECF subfamily)